tara:strand:- start:13997 stop:14116 length:120 start_codon:yes stop_codon:yes gene_type:complete
MVDLNSMLTNLLKLSKEELEELNFRASVELMEREIVDED